MEENDQPQKLTKGEEIKRRFKDAMAGGSDVDQANLRLDMTKAVNNGDLDTDDLIDMLFRSKEDDSPSLDVE